MKNKYESYEKALNIIDLEQLSDRRNQLCKDFAQKAAKNGSIEFQLNIKSHTMNNRIQNIYEESHCNTRTEIIKISHTTNAEIVKHTRISFIQYPCDW